MTGTLEREREREREREHREYLQIVDKNLEKYSLVIVSNSLRSVTNYKASQVGETV